MCDIHRGHRSLELHWHDPACFDHTYLGLFFARSLSLFYAHLWSTCLAILTTLIELKIVFSGTSVRSTETRSADPCLGSSQSFDSEGYKRDVNNPFYDVIDRALKALSNDTELASNGLSGAEIWPVYQSNDKLKVARNSIYWSHCVSFWECCQYFGPDV